MQSGSRDKGKQGVPVTNMQQKTHLSRFMAIYIVQLIQLKLIHLPQKNGSV